jgi:hypothetical protein
VRRRTIAGWLSAMLRAAASRLNCSTVTTSVVSLPCADAPTW